MERDWCYYFKTERSPLPRKWKDLKFRQTDWQDTFDSTDEAILSLRSSAKFCDCTLKIDGEEFSTHSLLLQIRSPYFESVFSQRWNTNQSHRDEKDVLALEIPVTKVGFQIFLSRVYGDDCGQILNSGNIRDAWDAANYFQVKSMKKCCVWFILKKIKINSSNSLFYLDLVINSGYDLEEDWIILKECVQFVDKSNSVSFFELLLSFKWDDVSYAAVLDGNISIATHGLIDDSNPLMEGLLRCSFFMDFSNCAKYLDLLLCSGWDKDAAFLLQKCHRYIDENAESIFSCPDFYFSISPVTLHHILSRNSLHISEEIRLLEALAAYSCAKTALSHNEINSQQVQREFLIESNLLWSIRYTFLEQVEVEKIEFLTPEEKTNIISAKFKGLEELVSLCCLSPRLYGFASFEISMLPEKCSFQFGQHYAKVGRRAWYGSMTDLNWDSGGDAVQVKFDREVWLTGITLPCPPPNIQSMEINGWIELQQVDQDRLWWSESNGWSGSGRTCMSHEIRQKSICNPKGLFIGYDRILRRLLPNQTYLIKVTTTISNVQPLGQLYVPLKPNVLKISWKTGRSPMEVVGVKSSRISMLHLSLVKPLRSSQVPSPQQQHVTIQLGDSIDIDAIPVQLAV